MAAVSRALSSGRLQTGRALLKPCVVAPTNDQRRCVSKNAPSFALNAFRGEVVLKEVFPYPKVLTEEQEETARLLVDPTQKFFEEVNDAAKGDSMEKVPDDVMQGLRDLGAFGMQVPNELGGLGLTNTQYARLTEVVGAYDLGVGIQIGAHQSIGFKGILLFGTPEQKAKYLPKVSSGEWVAAFALTEPTSGSDANSIRTRAVPSKDGKHFILNGGKIWISNGGIAEVFTVFAQTPVTDPVTGATVDKVSAFIVQRSFGGITSGPQEKKMGIKASNTTEVHFDNVKIPKENLLGEYGKGFKIAMAILNNGRFGMGAALTGCMKGLIAKAADFAGNRTQFRSKISSFGMVQEKLARMAMKCYAAESIAYLLSSNMDRGTEEFQVEAAIGKIFASDMAWEVADECIQIHGGMGFMKETGLERVVRDLRIFRIFEGTNEILRLLVALTGCQFAGAHLKDIQKAMTSGDVNKTLDAGWKTLFLGSLAQNGGLADTVAPELALSAAKVTDCVSQLGLTVRSMLMEHGKGVIHKQFQLHRIADAAIDIYAMTACLSRCTAAIQAGAPTAEHELILTEAFCADASIHASAQLNNLKNPDYRDNFLRFERLSEHIVANGGYLTTHPLGF